MPIIIPMDKLVRNRKLAFMSLKKLVMESIALSYKLKLIISTEPLNPGIIFATPINIPFRNSWIFIINNMIDYKKIFI